MGELCGCCSDVVRRFVAAIRQLLYAAHSELVSPLPAPAHIEAVEFNMLTPKKLEAPAAIVFIRMPKTGGNTLRNIISPLWATEGTVVNLMWLGTLLNKNLLPLSEERTCL